MKKSELKRRIYTDLDKELIKYLKKEFGYDSERSMYEIRNKINILYSLEKKTLEFGITRMKTIEEANDNSKFLPPLIVLLIAFITSYSTFLNSIFNEDVISFLQLLIIGVYTIYFIKQMNVYRDKRTVSSYFINIFGFALKTKEELKE